MHFQTWDQPPITRFEPHFTTHCEVNGVGVETLKRVSTARSEEAVGILASVLERRMPLNTKQAVAYAGNGLLLALTLLGCGCMRSSSDAPPSPPKEESESEPHLPAKALWGSGIRVWDDFDCRPVSFDTGDPNVTATADYDTPGQAVEVRWLRTADGASSIQKVEVPFHPTSIAGSNDGRMLVAGSDPLTGRAVIEIWTFGEEGFLTSTGEAGAPDVLVPVLREVVHQAPRGADDLVEALFWNLGAEDRAFVQFAPSRELKELDLRHGTLTPLFDTDASTSTLSALCMTFGDKATVVHTELGNVYLLCGRGNNTSSLALVDIDKDGQLDPEHFISLPPNATDAQIDTAMYATGLLDPQLIKASY